MSDSMVEERCPVYDFDYVAGADVLKDVHEAYLNLKKNAPPLFWTPHNGGHWVVNNADLAVKSLRHPEIFSSQFLSIPPNPHQPKMIPESLDPPEHRPYRQMLRPFFEGKAIAPLEPRIIEWTEELIDNVANAGECDFVGAIGGPLPISVFMEMFGFPLDRYEEFRQLAVDYFSAGTGTPEAMGYAGQIMGVLAELIQSRMAAPQSDLVSSLITLDFEGRKLTFDELMSTGFLMFLAGLDTVTNALTFGMRHLAHDPALQQRMTDDPDCIPNAVEELLRRYTFVSTPRYIVQDTEIDGVQLRKGESILVPLHSIGLDDKLNPDPETVNVDRPAVRHAAFGSGVHTCLGLHLARMEMISFYKVWFRRIGRFELAPMNGPLKFRAGSVQSVEALPIRWTAKL
jgi:cytochrome P450